MPAKGGFTLEKIFESKSEQNSAKVVKSRENSWKVGKTREKSWEVVKSREKVMKNSLKFVEKVFCNMTCREKLVKIRENSRKLAKSRENWAKVEIQNLEKSII